MPKLGNHGVITKANKIKNKAATLKHEGVNLLEHNGTYFQVNKLSLRKASVTIHLLVFKAFGIAMDSHGYLSGMCLVRRHTGSMPCSIVTPAQLPYA